MEGSPFPPGTAGGIHPYQLGPPSPVWEFGVFALVAHILESESASVKRVYSSGERTEPAFERYQLSFDRRVGQVSPLLPRAVVVSYLRVVQDVAQDEPGVGRAHAQLAVHSDGSLPR